MSMTWSRHISRRRFLGGLVAAGTTSLFGASAHRFARGLFPSATTLGAEPPPEVTKIRLTNAPSLCLAPQYLAEPFLRSEGFAEIQYVSSRSFEEAVAAGEADMTMFFSARHLLQVEAGAPQIALAGVHVGCFELVAGERVRTVSDLKGKTVAVPDIGGISYTFLAAMMAYVGLDPRTAVNWVAHSPADAIRLLPEGKIDAFMALPPIAQEARNKKIGRVVVSSMMDRPWSNYYCCLVVGHRDFVRRYPVATKRAVRAILRAADMVVREPARAAKALVARGFTQRYDLALQTLRELPYGVWRELDPEDTLRFYALRLREAGILKSSPQKLIAQGTDWRFLKELKKEMKG